jgi:hypothetical protein
MRIPKVRRRDKGRTTRRKNERTRCPKETQITPRKHRQ